MDHLRSFQVAALSPVQWAAWAPVPGKLDLHAQLAVNFEGYTIMLCRAQSRSSQHAQTHC